MSLNEKPIDHEINQQQQLQINISDKDDDDNDDHVMPRHQTHEDTKPENENEIKRTPDCLSLSSRIIQILNSVHKKPATPDYTRISHHRICQQTSCRSLRVSNENLKGPFFISFKEKPVMIETNYYNERFRSSFFDQTFSNPRCIGKGSFGEVFKAFSKDDKRWYAVKITVEPFRSPADREDKLREVQKHELLPKHPNLISFVRAWEEYGFLYIQTELCQCSLLDYKMKVGIIPEKDLWLFFGDIALAVRYLHSHELLHLDIKPQNIMVSFDGICKLGDFSLIVDIQKDSREEEGDGKYLAPEVLQSGARKPSDIFSLGMTMVDICTDLELPTTGDLWQGFRFKRIYHEFIKDVPPALLDIVLLLLETDPSKRPTAEEICCIPMIAKCIHERQYKYLERNMWWILLTIGYSSLLASSWIVQPARSTIMHATTYLKRMHIYRHQHSAFHRVFRATSDESPMFKHGIIPRVSDSSRLQLRFEEDDDDYKYDDTETGSGERMEMSQSEDELVNVMETSASEELRYDQTETVSRMDVDTPSSSSLESGHEFEQNGYGGDTNGLTNLFHNKTTSYQFGAAGDVFESNDCNISHGEEIPDEQISNKENSFTSEDFELRRDISACDTLEYEDHELPSTSGSISDRPKSPEPPPSDEASPLRDGYITPPSNTTPSLFVCKTPARGRFDDSVEQRLRHYYWWRESFRSPTRRTHQEAIETTASKNDASPEAPNENQLSGLEAGFAQSVGNATRRRAYFHMRESSPSAKRAQIDNKENTDDDEDQIDDPKVKKSGTGAK
ncbi:WEE protein kinase [Loa loa]|uniref:non-specific serine/threonine protein kinase n=1 Tax=Loa loa TaxID=7209 RepID=A0A1S0U8E9_LOALO|nr:WEE protein kinase [Loa loa]EFO26595.2 WEE protein kinase [Loa loa]